MRGAGSVKIFLGIIAFLLISFELSASHIIGGFIRYDHLGNGLYRFQVYMYRDCNPLGNPIPLDQSARIGVYYETDDGEYELAPGGRIISGLQGPIPVDPPAFACLSIPPNVCVEEGYYEFNFQVEGWPRNNSVVVSYQRCCRNPTTTNIFTPGEVGVTFTAEITPEAMLYGNNSPDFKEFPPIVICSDFPLEFDHSGIDSEGDSLVYYFCEPLVGAGRAGGGGFPGNAAACDGIAPDPGCPPPYFSVDFISPQFTFQEPMAGNPIIKIDSLSGLIYGTPDLHGQFVVAVCMEEYRDSILLSKSRRDFQFTVTDCNIDVEADVVATEKLDEKLYYIKSCGDLNIEIENISSDKRYITGYNWIFEETGETFEIENLVYTFPDYGRYECIMIANPGFFCADTVRIIIDIFEPINMDFSYAYDSCSFGPVMFTNNSVSLGGDLISVFWDFGDGGTSINENPNYTYSGSGEYHVTQMVTDVNGCENSITKPIFYFPLPPELFLDPFDTLACIPAVLDFSSLNGEFTDDYILRWDFGDGNTSDEIRPVHVYSEPGNYTITVFAQNIFGCEVQGVFSNYVTVYGRPDAGFSFSPEKITNRDPLVRFTNTSEGAINYIWDFGGFGSSAEINPVFNFSDTGHIDILLIAFSEFGCTDTIIIPIDVIPVISYFVPNAFTPDSDGINDFFLGKGALFGIKDFNFRVFNRYGQQLFFTKEPEEGWNGRINSTGELQSPAVFVYKVDITGPRGELYDFEGTFLLLR